jgi:hypothetical protein
MDQFAEGAFIGSEAVGGVETPKPGAAQRAAAFEIQRKGVQKRRPATDAEEFRLQRPHAAEACATNRHARDVKQRGAADAAILREEKREKGAGG